MKKEIWKPIPGFEIRYEVSNHGRIKSLPKWRNNRHGGYITKEKLLSPRRDTGEYNIAQLTNGNGKFEYKKVSRLVGLLFVPNPKKLSQINHKDGNPKNDYFENLEWVTPSENQLHAYRTGLKKATYLGKFGKDHNQSIPITITNGKIKKRFESKTACAKHLNVSIQAIAQAIRNETKSKGFIISEI